MLGENVDPEAEDKMLAETIAATIKAGGLPPSVYHDILAIKEGRLPKFAYNQEQITTIKQLVATLTVEELQQAFTDGFGVGLYVNENFDKPSAKK